MPITLCAYIEFTMNFVKNILFDRCLPICLYHGACFFLNIFAWTLFHLFSNISQFCLWMFVSCSFAAALRDIKVWVMNVVTVDSQDTLPIIYERGLFGIYHDWCESFSTYPRTYDLLHADHLFSKLKTRFVTCIATYSWHLWHEELIIWVYCVGLIELLVETSHSAFLKLCPLSLGSLTCLFHPAVLPSYFSSNIVC